MSVTDINGVEHCVCVNADTLFEAVARGLRAIRESVWAGGEMLPTVKLFSLWDMCKEGGCTTAEFIEGLRPLDRRGGSHNDDWRCPKCHHFTTSQTRLCARCGYSAPPGGRPMTRKALRELAAEHRTRAILAKHGLLNSQDERLRGD